MKAFDPDGPVRRRDGLPARIICTNAWMRYDHDSAFRPIIALIASAGEQQEYVRFYFANGSYDLGKATDIDLVNETGDWSDPS